MNTTMTHGGCDEMERVVDAGQMSRDEFEQHFQSWVDSVRWQFAKTYAKKAPHEYTVTDWNPELDPTFNQCVLFIRQHGQVDLYHGHPFTVYYLNGWKYWTMGDPLEETTLINRTCEAWSTAFKLTWNPPAWFKPMPASSAAKFQRIAPCP